MFLSKKIFFTEHVCPQGKYKYRTDTNLCEFCSLWSPNSKENIKHCNEDHKSHIASIWQSCTNCIYYYPTKEHLQEHFKNSHSYKKKCNICKSNFTYLRQHNKNVHKNENEKKPCAVCLNYFQNNRELSTHFGKEHFKNAESRIKIALKSPKPACNYCQLNFKTVSAVLQHSNTEHQNDAIADSWSKCPKCSLYLPTVDTLKAHSCHFFEMHQELSDKSDQIQSRNQLAGENPQPHNSTTFTSSSLKEKEQVQVLKSFEPSVETLTFIPPYSSSIFSGSLNLQESTQSNNTQQTQSHSLSATETQHSHGKLSSSSTLLKMGPEQNEYVNEQMLTRVEITVETSSLLKKSTMTSSLADEILLGFSLMAKQ